MNKQDYYVYVHRRLDNNEIFYVGSGRGDRATTTRSRNSHWKNIASSVGYNSEIIQSGMTKEKSIDFERKLIDNIGLDNLTNVYAPRNILEMSYLDFSEYFAIDDKSPSGLIRIKDIKCNNHDVATNSSVVGYFNKTYGGWSVLFKNKSYQVHRIVYLLYHGSISPNLVVDHINGDRSDNRITNLRAISYDMNTRNRKKPNNKSSDLPTGVRFNEQCKHFVAQVSDPSKQYRSGGNKLIRKCFTLLQFKDHPNPYEAAKQAAIEARKQMLEELNNRLNLGYTVDHGT